MYFAQLDQDGYCFAITQFGEPPVGPQFVPIAELDTFFLGKRYLDGAWQ